MPLLTRFWWDGNLLPRKDRLLPPQVVIVVDGKEDIVICRPILAFPTHLLFFHGCWDRPPLTTYYN
jgi:hypothetical protein